ncbi:MAG: hypothetical protein R6W06_07325 [Prochlorococcaceae cyanobacterium]
MSARTLPTSRAYWELRAEQVMDRVFTPVDAVDSETSPAAEDPDSPIDVLVRDEGPTGTAHRPPGTRQPGNGRQPRSRTSGLRAWPGSWNLPAVLPARSRQLVALSSVICLTMGGLSLVLWRNWSVARQDLRQERNLLLLERLRDLGPTGETTTAAKAESSEAAGAAKDKPKDEQATADGLPPPPAEAWMEELAALPQSSAPAAEVLRVPVSSAISRPAPAATGGGGYGGGGGGGSSASSAGGAGGSLPQLVGVVQVPGRAGSAIFQLGGSSSSAAVGESIGGSGWRLRSASGDTAVIERGGEQRQVSISSGF